MKYLDLADKVRNVPVFSFADVLKLFPCDSEATIRVQLSHWTQQKKLIRLRRGLYLLAEHSNIDPYSIARQMYVPSYISLESALSYHGMIPEVPALITSVSTRNPQSFVNALGSYTYRKIKSDCYFGYVMNGEDPYRFQIAAPEKALLDYVYFSVLDSNELSADDMRLELPAGFKTKLFLRDARVFKNTSVTAAAERLVRS